MINTVHYSLRTASFTGNRLNAVVTYEVYYDRARGIVYNVGLQAYPREGAANLELIWQAKIVNLNEGRRLEYDFLKRIYYQTAQTVKVESALINLQEDLTKFVRCNQAKPVKELDSAGIRYPGKRLATLTIWYDAQQFLPVRRENRERGHLIRDEFVYHSINEPLAPELFTLERPTDAIADFNLYPEPPTLSRFECPPDANDPQYGIYLETFIAELQRFVMLNQWEYGPLATLKLPWLTEMPLTIYRAKNAETLPPLVGVVDPPLQNRTYFFIDYDFLGYVVTGFTQDPYNLDEYKQLPLSATLSFTELAPLYQAPSLEKEAAVNNFVTSVRSNDYLINTFEMGGKYFDLIVKNFSFHENEGYLLLNLYGKEYWDSANMEAMFQYVVSGRMHDAHTTAIIIYTLNVLKRMGIYRNVLMPSYPEEPLFESTAGQQ
ncbi:MAG: hypothetical protein PVH64_11900 [Bacillota bacterium]|jgi:hypothetical protein